MRADEFIGGLRWQRVRAGEYATAAQGAVVGSRGFDSPAPFDKRQRNA